MDREEKIYFFGTCSFEELLDAVEHGDIQFLYKDVEYNITFDKKPCIVIINSTTEEWYSSIRRYDTYEQLLNMHVMSDGVSLLDALKISRGL